MSGYFRQLILLLCLFSAFTLLAQGSGLPNNKSSEADISLRYDDGEELFFTVLLDRNDLGELPALVNDDSLALELDSYFSLLEFSIFFDRANLIYSGWFIKEDYRFFLDVKDRNSELEIVLSDRSIIVPVGQFKFIDNFLYINSEVLSDAFKISHQFKIDALNLSIIPAELIPLQQRLARRSGKSILGQNTPQYVNLDRSYQLLSPQLLDMNLSTAYRESTDTISSRYSIQGSRDVALVHSNFFITGNNGDLVNDVRLNFSRDSLTANLLGPLKATRLEFGDIRPVRQGRNSSLGESRGIRIANTQFANQIDNELINIEGDVAFGWDAQLFRNGVLLGQQFEIENGRYNFLDIPLNFGLNEFEVILYGPQGQIIVEKFERLVDRDLVGGRGLNYNLSINQQDKSLFGVRDLDQPDDGFNLSTQLSWGVGGSSLGLGAQRTFSADGEQDYTVNIGGSTVINNSILLASQFSTSDLSHSISLGARARLLNQSINANVSFAKARLDDANSVTGNFQASGALKLADGFILPMENQLRISLTDLENRYEFSNRVGLNNRLISLFSTLNYTKIDRGYGISTDFLSGSLSTQSSIGPIFARASINYGEDLFGEIDIRSYQASFNWALSNSFRTRLSLNFDTATENTGGALYLGWLNDNIELNSTATFSDIAGWQANLAARFTFSGQDISYNSIYQTNRALTQAGSIAVKVFHDLNGNALYDKGEPVIPDVEVSAVQVFRKAITNEEGIATLTGISNYLSSDITINEDTLPDPFLKPLVKGVSIKFRAGFVDKLDFPLIMGTDIEGKVDIVKQDTISAGRSISVELINKHGKVTDTARTAADGYYFFSKVSPGTYLIKVADADLLRNDIRKRNIHYLTVTQTSEFISDINFLLEQQTYEVYYFASLGKLNSYKSAVALASILGQKQTSLRSLFFIQKLEDQHMLAIAAADSERIVNEVCVSRLTIKVTCKAERLLLPIKPYELE